MNTYMKQLLLVALIFVAANATGSKLPQTQSIPRVSEEFKAEVKSLLNAMGYEKTLRENLTATYSKSGLDGEMVNGMIDELANKMPDKMVDIYAKHFTLDQIKELTKINNEEVNKKLFKYTPQISQDMMQFGQDLASGKTSPLAGISVSSDFEKVMKEY